MPRIANNRICYPRHNVVLDPSVHKARPDYIMDIEAALTPEGDAKLHQAQLDSFTGINCWVIERPTILITPMPAFVGEEPPSRMMADVTLHNGNYEKVICSASCARHESFLPLYGAMNQRGIDVGRTARREAETAYFKLYDALVAAANQPKE